MELTRRSFLKTIALSMGAMALPGWGNDSGLPAAFTPDAIPNDVVRKIGRQVVTGISIRPTGKDFSMFRVEFFLKSSPTKIIFAQMMCGYMHMWWTGNTDGDIFVDEGDKLEWSIHPACEDVLIQTIGRDSAGFMIHNQCMFLD